MTNALDESARLLSLLENPRNPYDFVRLEKFVQSIKGLYIPEDSIQGNVLVCGTGAFMPERALLCNPLEKFKKPKRSITSLFTIDERYETNGNIQVDPNFTFTHLQKSMTDFFNFLPIQFDLITFFRIADFVSQLDLQEISTHLKPGGYFMGSGSAHRTFPVPMTISENDFRASGEELGLEMISYARLQDVDSSDFWYTENTGVVFRKVNGTEP